MSELSGFFDAHSQVDDNGQVVYDRVYLAESFAKYFASFIGNGIFGGKSNELMVKQKDPASMSVRVLSGKAWIDGYWYENDDELFLNIDIADGILNRKDIVVLRWDNYERVIRLVVVKGTPASNAVAPQLQRNNDYYDLKLAEINVKAGATNITQANILDTRLDSNVCGLVTGVVKQLDTSEMAIQLDAFINELVENKTTWFNNFKSESTEEFDKFISDNQEAVDNLISAKTAEVNQMVSDNNAKINNFVLTKTEEVSQMVTDNNGKVNKLINDTSDELTAMESEANQKIAKLTSDTSLALTNLINGTSENVNNFISSKGSEFNTFLAEKEAQFTTLENETAAAIDKINEDALVAFNKIVSDTATELAAMETATTEAINAFIATKTSEINKLVSDTNTSLTNLINSTNTTLNGLVSNANKVLSEKETALTNLYNTKETALNGLYNAKESELNTLKTTKEQLFEALEIELRNLISQLDDIVADNDLVTINNSIANAVSRIVSLEATTEKFNKLFVESATKGCYYRVVEGENEWVNPPNEIGIEYRLTERWFGNPVYQKSFYIGNLPNKSVMTIEANGVNYKNIIFISGFAVDVENNMFYPFPIILNGLAPIAVIQSAEGNGDEQSIIIIQTNDDISYMYGCITIKYTKK